MGLYEAQTQKAQPADERNLETAGESYIVTAIGAVIFLLASYCECFYCKQARFWSILA